MFVTGNLSFTLSAASLWSFSVSSGVGLCLAVTVGAQHTQILQAIIVALAVAMIDLNCKRLAAPTRQSALLANILKQPGREETPLDCVSTLRIA
jgi:hypothetical protein